MSKHPQLRTEHLAEGVAYMTAYARLERGWSFERACNEPPHKKRPTRTLAEREAFYLAKWMNRSPDATPRSRKQRVEPVVKDTAPLRIQKIRAALCDGFIKTGVLDADLQKQLSEYAYECRTAGPKPTRHRKRQPRVADDSGEIRDEQQVYLGAHGAS